MTKKYRVGLIGFAHMHINSLIESFSQHPQVELVACADTVPNTPELREAPYTRSWNVKLAQEKYGVKKTYTDYHRLLNQEKVDIIICCSENARHAEVTEAAAAVKAHVLVEKPMASSLDHALRMVRACQAANVSLVTNWPTTWSTAVRKTKQLIEEGIIGRVLEVKWRGGSIGPLGSGVTHPGVTKTAEPMNSTELAATWWHQADTGGGSMLDYCCYGSKLACWYIGQPGQAAVGLKANLNNQWGSADDNAAMLVRFPGAMGLFESSWTTLDHGVSPGPIVYGTEGTLIVERKGQQIIRLEKGQGQTTLYEDCGELPVGRATIAEDFIHHLETGEALHPTLEVNFNLEVMAILDAGIRAAENGTLTLVDNAAWCVG